MRANVFRDQVEEAMAVEAVRKAGARRPGEGLYEYLDRINAERDEPDYWPVERAE